MPAGMLVLNDHIEYHLQCLQDDNDNVDNEVEELSPEQKYQNELENDVADENNNIEQKRQLFCYRSELSLLFSHLSIGIMGYITGSDNTIVWKALNWTCMMVSLGAIYQTCRIFQKRSSQRHCEQQSTARLELIELLGTIGAPDLPISVHGGSDIVTRLLPLAHAQVNMLHDMTRSMEVVRMTTGMRLEVGPYSPSVERMELSTTKPSLAKRLLAETMIHQRTSLLRLIAIENEETETPAVVTIQWLKGTHRELCCLLSDVINNHFNAPSKYRETNIQEAITEAGEASSYLKGIFGFSRPKNVGCQPVSDIQQHLEAAHAALWEFEHETDPETKQEWCERFQILLSNLSAHGLNEMFLRQGKKPRVTSYDLNTENIATSGETLHRSKIDHYEHVIQSNFEATMESKSEKRVLIFSGKGKSNRLPYKNLEDRMTEQSSTMQSKVLNELHNRLATLDTTEEVDANEISYDEREDDSSDCDFDQTSSSVFPLLSKDVSSILSELHLALANTPVVDDAICIG